MAVRQYIGARYVPIFLGEWEANVSYEPLSVVSYLQSTYTSKKTVPAGTLPTNTEYWANTGNYNAQVEEYRQEVVALSQQINGKVKMIKTNPEIALLGDSSIQLMTYPQFITDFFEGAHVTNYNDGSVASVNWRNLINQINAITTTPDIIFIWCGGNDISNLEDDMGGRLGAPDVEDHTVESAPTTTFACMKYCINELRNRYPNAEIFNIMRPILKEKRSSAVYYVQYYQYLIMHEWSVPVIDGEDLCNFTQFNEAQKALFTLGGGNSHFNSTMFQRLWARISNAYHAGSPTGTMLIPPQWYFVPASVCDVNPESGPNGYENKRAIVNWVAQHCLVPGASYAGGTLMGTAYAAGPFGAGGAASVCQARFDIYANNGSNQNVFYIHMDGVTYHGTGSANGIANWGSVIQQSLYNADSTPTLTPAYGTQWYNIPDGDYTCTTSNFASLGFDSSIPAAAYYIKIRSVWIAPNWRYAYRYAEVTNIPGNESSGGDMFIVRWQKTQNAQVVRKIAATTA